MWCDVDAILRVQLGTIYSTVHVQLNNRSRATRELLVSGSRGCASRSRKERERRASESSRAGRLPEEHDRLLVAVAL